MNLTKIHESSPFNFQGAGWPGVENSGCIIINWLLSLRALTRQMPWQLLWKSALTGPGARPLIRRLED